MRGAMIRVLIIDEVPLICNVLASMLKEEPDLQVVGCATTLEEAGFTWRNVIWRWSARPYLVTRRCS